MTFTVRLNGLDKNPYANWGLKQNPFPQIADEKYSRHLLHLAALGGEPIPDQEFIRLWLKGWSDEFVNLCCKKFEKGKMITFDVTFND